MTSTLSFKVALIKLLIVSLFSISILKANPPLLVNDAQANATATITASRMAEQIEKAAKMIEQYNKIIEEAKATVGELNKINEVMNGVNSFLNGSSIQIANPFEPLKDIGDIFDRMKNNAQRLQKTLKNYEARDHLHWKKLSSNCPYLNYDKIAPKEENILFTNVGKESKEIKAMKRLANALSDDIVSNTQSVAGTLSGRALALEFCKKASELRNKIQQHKCKLKMKEDILAKNFEKYTEDKKECYESERQYKKDMSVLRDEQVNPLINRSKQMMEALGVLDKSYNKGKKIYCKEGKNDANEFCYPLFYDTKRLNDEFIEIQNELVTKLQKAGNDKTKQASAYADIKQKTDTLTLSYIKDIANNLGFMNETMALVGNLIARDYKNKYGEDDYDEVDKEFDKKVAELNENYKTQTSQYKGFKQYKAKLNKYGFPIVSFTSKKEDTD